MGTLVDSFAHNGPGKADVAVESILLFFGYVSLGMRLWSRQIKGVGWQLNDWLIIIATILMTGRYISEVLVILLGGLGLHFTEVKTVGGPEALVKFFKLAFVVDLLWVTIVALIKVSILHFYITVFYTTPRLVQASWIMMAICVSYWIGTFFAYVFFCSPVQRAWYPELPGHCGDNNLKYTAAAGGDLVIDVIIIILPMPVLWALQLRMAKKIALMAVFALGFLIIAITAVRFKFIYEIDVNDVTFSFWRLGLFSAMVPLLGLVSANVPLCPPAFQKIFRTDALATQARSTLGSNQSPFYKKKGSGFEESQFDRLDDPDIPLVDVHPGGHDHVGKNNIKVTTHLDVNSMRRG